MNNLKNDYSRGNWECSGDVPYKITKVKNQLFYLRFGLLLWKTERPRDPTENGFHGMVEVTLRVTSPCFWFSTRKRVT